MKSIVNKITVLLFPVIVTVAINSCSNPSDGYDPNKYANIAMPQAQENPANRAFPIVDSAQTLIYSAAYRGANHPKTDIPVSFSVSPALVDSFNARNGTSHPILPSDSYEFGKKMATIPRGGRSTGKLEIKIHASGHLKAQGIQYLLPVTMRVDIDTTKLSVPINKDLQTAYFLIKGSYVNIKKDNWKIIDFDSEQPGRSDLAVEKVIDGDESTFWNTQYSDPRPGPPHHVTVDMGKTYTVNGFRIVGRPKYKNQNPKNVTIQFSDDGINWRDGQTFSLPLNEQDIITTKVYLSNSVEARYFRFIINRDVEKAHKPTNLNELYAF